MIVLINGDYQTFVGSDEDGSPLYEPYFLMLLTAVIMSSTLITMIDEIMPANAGFISLCSLSDYSDAYPCIRRSLSYRTFHCSHTLPQEVSYALECSCL